MHSQIVKKDAGSSISKEEWTTLPTKFNNFHITNKLKQQNPFTEEFLYMDVPGSGYWTPSNYKYEGWPYDGNVWFMPEGYGVTFIQFADINDKELNEIANSIDAKVVHHDIG